MEQPPSENQAPKARLACYIRLNKHEYDRLQKDAKITGRPVQYLLKHTYFKGGHVVLLMLDDDRDKFMAQLHRIGNNVNQIAKHLNSGFAFGFQQELETIRSQLSLIITWLTASYGSHRDDSK